ncbi:MAG TPA: acyltransferase family protein [Acidimicrobiales bacterium]|nr:acyltransferase family protein [Acidimicrobiales bacterium]
MTSTVEGPSVSSRGPVSSLSTGYVPGLDGLRAIAVSAVLLYHADLTWMPGGFLGVDVFFVISGYLITSLLMAEHVRSGTIALRTFWRRRARRLLPALYAMLAIVTVVSAVFYRSAPADLRAQLAPAFTYWTNWYLIVSHHSYFAVIGRPPVLQHLWSLAVEEQFYLIWPVLLLGLFRAFRGRTALIAGVTAAGALASAAWMYALYNPVGDPSRVYYGTDTRASGLLLGAVLALIWLPHPARERTMAHRQREQPRSRVLEGLGVLALAGLLGCFALMRQTQSSLYPGGFLLVAGLTLVLIVAVVDPAARLTRQGFGHPLLVWLGKRSYAIYLWHWPIFVFTRPRIDLSWGTYPTLILRLALTLIAADLSYRYVEEPVRNGALSRWIDGLRGPVTRIRQRRRRATTYTVFASSLVVALLGVSLVTATRPLSAVERSIRFGGAAAPPSASSARIKSLASPTQTPTPTPPLAGAPPTGVTPTTTPAAPKTMTVIADSVLLSARQMLVQQFTAAGWQVDYRGHPAIMIKEAVKTLQTAGTPVGSVVVVGIGYNSLWQRNRANFSAWANEFDPEAENLLTTLKQLGAKTIVWVTLREPSASVVPPLSKAQYDAYVWYFPYVNERLHALQQRHPDLLLADWAAISNRPGITYDAIHLNTAGAQLMTNLIRSTIGG